MLHVKFEIHGAVVLEEKPFKWTQSHDRRKFCLGRRKFSNGHCDLIPLQIFFFILTSMNTKVYKLSAIYAKPLWRKN